MRLLFLVLSSALSLCGFAQLDKSVSLRASTNFDIALKGLATNDAGFGLGFDASFFSRNKLQALVETSADYFVGDKLLVTDLNTGEAAKRPSIYSIKAGPQLFVTKKIALAATYGPSWHVVREFAHTLNYGFRYSITGFFGGKHSVITKVFLMTIPTDEQSIQYLGISLGLRLL